MQVKRSRLARKGAVGAGGPQRASASSAAGLGHRGTRSSGGRPAVLIPLQSKQYRVQDANN
jgi:hypothetical protein